VKLLLREDGWEQAFALWERAESLATGSISYVEARSALAAAARAGRLGAGALRSARAALEELWRDVDVVNFHSRLVQPAGDVAEFYRLRSHDALHLTSALTLGDPELVLVSWDGELRRAGAEAGLAVAPAL